jgi:hypothetical protein
VLALSPGGLFQSNIGIAKKDEAKVLGGNATVTAVIVFMDELSLLL